MKESLERSFQDLVEHAPDALVFIDQTGNIVLVNEQTEGVFGHSRSNLLGQPLEILIPPRYREGHVRLRQAYARDPVPRPMSSRSDLKGLRRDGSEFACEISLSTVGAGASRLICAAIRDITARKSAEREIEASLHIQSALNAILRVSLEPISLEAQLQRILDHLLGIPWISLQAKGSIFLLDPGSTKLRLAVQRGLPEDLLAVCHDVQLGECLCGRAAASGEIVFSSTVDRHHEITYPSSRPHGHYCVPITSADRVCGIINLYVDEGHIKKSEEETFLSSVARVVAGMIARQQSEEALRQSEERFNLAVRGTDAGIWDWDVRRNRLYLSPRWKSMLGYEPEEIPDDYAEWETRLHPEDRDRALSTLRDYLENRSEEYELAHRLLHKDGTYRWILARGAAVRDENGKPYRMVGSHLDITALRQAEKALKENEFQLFAAQKIQENLLPSRPPSFAGFDLAGSSYPAEAAGGDAFDYVLMPDGSLCITISDVTGHGFASALLMASTQAYLRSLIPNHSDLSKVMLQANSALYRDTGEDRFVTLVLAHIDPLTRSLSYCSAGHPTGYVLDGRGSVKAALESTAMPLGLMLGPEFPAGKPVPLESGDTVVLLTDGVLEAQSPAEEFFGSERTLKVIRSSRSGTAAEMVESLYRATLEFSRAEKPGDDFTAVVIKVL